MAASVANLSSAFQYRLRSACAVQHPFHRTGDVISSSRFDAVGGQASGIAFQCGKY
jgi:hypothetical protein